MAKEISFQQQLTDKLTLWWKELLIIGLIFTVATAWATQKAEVDTLGKTVATVKVDVDTTHEQLEKVEKFIERQDEINKNLKEGVGDIKESLKILVQRALDD